MKVLFCGRMMNWGFKFTHVELEPDPHIDVIQCDVDEVPQYLADADIAVPLMTPLTAELLHNAPKLKLIIQYGAGVEAVDIKTATELGIFVSNIPTSGTGNSTSCAEMAIFLTLATLRNINTMQESIKTRRLGVPLGNMLQGKTILVLGFGGIAKDLIVRLVPFGVKLMALRRSPTWGNHTDELSRAAEAALVDRGTWPDDTARLARNADIVIVTCKMDASNAGMVNKAFLGSCKDGVYIVNVARGGLLEYSAVLEGLNSGKIRGMGLDVQFWEPFDPEDPIAKHPACFLTPHVAGVTEQSYRAMAKVVATESRKIFNKERPTIQLNNAEEMRAIGAEPRV